MTKILVEIDPVLFSEEEVSIAHFIQDEAVWYFSEIMSSDTETLEIRCCPSKNSLRYDGYHVEAGGHCVRIESGCIRGILHGLYELLRQLGCDFTFPGKKRQRVPKHNVQAIPNMQFTKEPWLEYRGLCFYGVTKKTQKQMADAVDWMAKNGFNFLLTSIYRADDTGKSDHAILWEEIESDMLADVQRRGIVLDMSEHSMDYFLPRKEVFNEHPEWFALYNGVRQPSQLCYSCDSAVSTYGEKISEFVEKRSEISFLGLWPNDGGGYCQCENCSNPQTVYRAAKKIAERIKKVRPDLIVEHLAYTPQSYSRPQDRMPDNMSVLVCDVRDRVARQWQEKAGESGGAFYFDYGTGDHYRWKAQLWLNPYECREMVNTMEAYHYRGIVSLYLPITCWWQASINYWYLRRFYYDPTLDVDLLTKELSQLLFGERVGDWAASQMTAIYKKLQDPVLWSMEPFAVKDFCTRLKGRNADLDELHKVSYTKAWSGVMEEITHMTNEVDAYGLQNMHFLQEYLELQKCFYEEIDSFNGAWDEPKQAEKYICRLKHLETEEDNPFISSEYAGWRILGRDCVFTEEGGGYCPNTEC